MDRLYVVMGKYGFANLARYSEAAVRKLTGDGFDLLPIDEGTKEDTMNEPSMYYDESNVVWLDDGEVDYSYMPPDQWHLGYDQAVTDMQAAPVYTHRNGERDDPAVEGWYWVEYNDMKYGTVALFWDDDKKKWLTSYDERVPVNKRIWGPIPMPGGTK